ncbi:hypothetical protein GQ43DRAFT_367981, partial [Delitschia confertaspora ATCC 74209]
ETMDGRNSCGRRISLLNEELPQPHCRLPSITPSLRSRTSSYTSSPIGSPAIPPLVRSDSSDSTVSMQPPSPATPEFGFDGRNMDSPIFSQAPIFPQKDTSSAYPPLTQISGPLQLPYHPASAPQTTYYRPQLGTETLSSSANSRPKNKNSYPCPMAKQFGCNDYFTTSGHAARHAKKHTGKKDAFCPECNKAFTRKDNMEQHRRTHQSGRNANKSGDERSKKSKPSAKRPRPSPLQSSAPSLSTLSVIDPALSPTHSTYSITPAVSCVDAYSADYSQRSPYPDPAAFSLTPTYSVGSCFGLDALAIACGEKRKYEAA